ncbi:MAG: fibronectin type III domain-containing protein [Patescibacteria group bacterium]
MIKRKGRDEQAPQACALSSCPAEPGPALPEATGAYHQGTIEKNPSLCKDTRIFVFDQSVNLCYNNLDFSDKKFEKPYFLGDFFAFISLCIVLSGMKKTRGKRKKHTIPAQRMRRTPLAHRRRRAPAGQIQQIAGAFLSRVRALRTALIIIAILSLGGFFAFQYITTYAVSDSVTISSQTEWEAGEYWKNQLNTTNAAGDLSIASGGVGSWDLTMPSFPEDTRGYFAYGQEPADLGTDLTTDGTYLYMIIGGRQPELFRYNPELGTWKQLADAPTDFYDAGALTYYDGYLYATNGHDGLTTTDAAGELWRYDIAGDAWAKMASAPSVWGSTAVGGADIESGNNGKLYAVQGHAQAPFWIYDIASNTWADGPTVPDPISTANSHALVYSDVSFGTDPVYCETGCIYAFLGNSRTFLRYDISMNQWYSSFADVPAALGNVTTGSALAFDAANDDLYAFRGGSTEFMKYDIDNPGTWDAATLTTPNTQRNVTTGASLVYLDGYIYGTLGGVPELVRYDVGNGRWDAVVAQNATGTNSGDLVVYVPDNVTAGCTDDSGCLFVAQGGGTGLRRYDIGARAWSAALTVVPAAFGLNGTMCFDGTNTIYMARAGNQTMVYPYSISGNSYGTTITAPGAVQQGAGIVCTAANRFYLLRGNATNSFYYYNGTTLAADDNIPAAAVGYGGGLSWDGTYVYALAGDRRGNFYRFDPSQGSGSRWSVMNNLPTTAYYVSSLEYDGAGNIYVIPGQYEKDFWRYDVSENSWSRASELPQRFGYAHGLAYDSAAGKIWVLRGGAPSTNSVGFHMFTPEAHAYIPSATWISAPIDLDYVSSFTDLTATTTTPGGTSVAYVTRTSDDSVSWSDWATVVGGAIASPANRYMQVKATLTSDDTNTPTLSDFTITYESDSTDPIQPSIVGYDTSAKAATLTTGNSYYYTNPYFEFSDATDSDSRVTGYYVSWTTNASHNPASSEDYFQTAETYSVQTPLAAGSTYSLRVATKDAAGNVTDAETKFTYTYTGISPAATKQWSSQAEFAAGTVSNVSTSANAGNVQLSAMANGAWANEAPTNLNLTTGSGASMVFNGNDTVYILRGTTTQTFWAYSVANKTYTTLANYGNNVTTGASMIFVPAGTSAGCADAGGCVFASRGGSTTEFRRYDVNANTWTQLTDGSVLPLAAGNGASFAYNSSDTLYYLSGSTAPSTRFYKYTISTGTWTQLPDVDQTIGLGGTLTYVPSGAYCSDATGCLFATRGNYDTDFYRYRIQANAWSYMPNTPFGIGDGASIRYANGYVYLLRGSAASAVPTNNFVRYDLTTNQWEHLADTPTNIYQGSEQGLAYISTKNEFLTFRGYSEYAMFAYDITENAWRTPSLPHHYTSNGYYYGAVAYDTSADLLYVARGGTYTDWWAYDPALATWQQKADVPHNLNIGASAEYVNHANNTYDGTYMLVGYEAQGDSVGHFFRYSAATDSWTRLANTPAEPGTAGGADLVYDGTDAIYTAQGGTTSYYKYTISTNTWTTVVSTIWAAPSEGSCAVKVDVGGTDYIYLTRAANTTTVYRFNIGTQTWDAAATVEVAPGALRYGNACVADGQGNILIPRGNSTTDMYVLDPDGDANGVWTTRSTLSPFYYGGLVMTTNSRVMGFRGYNSSALETYVVPTASTAFAPYGTWTSEITDFGAGLYGYGGLTINSTDVSNASITYQTRTCSDAGCAADASDSHWGSWTDVTENREISGTDTYRVASTVARYGQIRAVFKSDQVYTPTLADITWAYYADTTAPTNPSEADGWTDATKVTTVTTDTWGGDATPYFEWTVTENSGGIGVDGSYVYFGTNSALDPVDDADDATNLAYRSGTNYYAANSSGLVSWNVATQAASTPTSGTYYLKVKSKDLNDNVTATAASVFIFKLDTDGPTTPTGVTASPAGYSSTDSFAFTWSASADTGSGVAEYCWKTGADGAVDTCQAASPRTLSGVTSYQTRGNTLSIRAKDNAGNYSSYATATYYYAGTPPTAPQGLAPNPTEAVDTNAFSFSWSLPETCLGQTPCEAGDIVRYCYTINVEPSAGTCGTNLGGSATPSPDGGWTTSTQTANRLLPGFSAATQQGTNIMYIVAADAINNIDYTAYISEEFDFTSNAPDVPTDMRAVDSSDRATQKFSATITWNEPEDVGAGVEEYVIYRCDANSSDCDAPSPTEDPPANYAAIASTSTTGYLDVGLDNTITYRYFVRAVGPGNAPSGNSAVVSIKPEGKFTSAPLMTGQPTITAKVTTATIEWYTQNDTDQQGQIIEHPASSFVEYGETDAYGSETGTSDLVNEHTVTISGLAPNTDYHANATWLDVDGNPGESGDFTFTTLGAPSAPTNLTVDPETNTRNHFTFAWDPPTDEGIVIGGYFYSINAIPTESNTSFTTSESVGPIAAATQQGENTLYLIAIDDSGNVDYDSYATISFEAHTTPPSAPTDLFIEDSSNRDAKKYYTTLTWTPAAVDISSVAGALVEGEDAVTYEIYRAKDDGDFEDLATVKTTAYLDADLEGGATYAYKIAALDSAGSVSEPSDTEEIVPTGRFTTPPEITVAPDAAPDSFVATITWETERVTSSHVEFGTSDDLGDEQGTADLVKEHSVAVTGLKPETKYYYRIKSIDIDENEQISDIDSFTTLEAPKVSDVEISDIKLYDATITWTSNKETTTALGYGTTTDYGFTVNDTSGSRSFNHSVKLTNLSDGTVYHVQLGGLDAGENQVASDDYIFTTLTFPRVLTYVSENKAEGETEVRWTTNVATTSEVEYYNENIPSRTQGNNALVTDHSVLLYGLEDATEYKFVIRGEDQFGNKAESDEGVFRTLEDTTPPVISNVQSESNTIGSGDAAKVQIIVSWLTNEPTSQKVEYGEGLSGNDFSGETDENVERVRDHLMVVSGLQPANTYHFRVFSRDKAGNSTYSSSYSILTSRSRQSFLQLVIANLEETFSWLGNMGTLFNN